MPDVTCLWPLGNMSLPTPPAYCGDPSGGTVTCCAKGDYCLENGICKITNYDIKGSSGYYTAGCSDGTIEMDSNICPSRCGDTGHPDIVWQSGDNWACCDVGGTLNCKSPSNEEFFAPAPSDLKTIWIAGSGPPSSTDSSSSTPTSSTTTTRSGSTSSTTSDTASTTTSTSKTSGSSSSSSSTSSSSTSTNTSPTPTSNKGTRIEPLKGLIAAAFMFMII